MVSRKGLESDKGRRYTVRSYHDYLPFTERVLRCLVKNVSIEGDEPPLEEILRKHPKLVIAQSHGPAAGPLAYTFMLCRYMSEAGGGDRKPIAVTHRLFYRVPLLDRLATYVTQVPEPVDFESFVELFMNDYNDFCLMPEGDHCNFGNGIDIMPFKSPRFVEIALRVGCPILVIAHAGAEAWGREIPIPNLLLKPAKRVLPKAITRPILASKRVNLPWLTKRLPLIKIKYSLFEVPETEKREEIEKIAFQVRKLMQQLTNELKSAF